MCTLKLLQQAILASQLRIIAYHEDSQVESRLYTAGLFANLYTQTAPTSYSELDNWIPFYVAFPFFPIQNTVLRQMLLRKSLVSLNLKMIFIITLNQINGRYETSHHKGVQE